MSVDVRSKVREEMHRIGTDCEFSNRDSISVFIRDKSNGRQETSSGNGRHVAFPLVSDASEMRAGSAVLVQ